MPPLPLLDDRRQVFEFYDEVCTRSYASLRSDQRLDHEQNLLKSYIIEVHQPGGTLEPGDRLRFLNRLLEPVKAEAIATREETLFNVRRGDFVVHCDALNDRFWVIHASTPAASTDRFIDEITRSSAAADSVWFHTAAIV